MISVVIPVWNGRELLARLLPTLQAQTAPAGEILVVDNGSRDGAPEIAQAAGARVIPMGRNAGFAAAVNRGIRESRGDWVAVLNSDVELAPDYFERLSATSSWFATGKIVSAASGDRIDGTFDATCRGGTSWRVGSGWPDSPEFNVRRQIWSAPWTAAVFRAGLFREIGLLDESFGSYLEDVDFGLRCARAGYAGEYLPEAVARHRGSASLGRWHGETIRLIARNQALILARHYPERLLKGWWWHITVAQLLWGAVAVRHGSGVSWLRGKIQGWREWDEIRAKSYPSKEELLGKILYDSERLIREFQQGEGDLYWRLYFLLTGGGAK